MQSEPDDDDEHDELQYCECLLCAGRGVQDCIVSTGAPWLRNLRLRQDDGDRTTANSFSSLKVGRVVIITRGRYAGKKAVIISPLDNGTKSHPFPHALVAGVERYPQKVTRRMSKNKQAKKSKVKPFVKQVNCT